MNSEIVVIVVYSILGMVWFKISGLAVNGHEFFRKLPKLILFLLIWPLTVLIRVERAYRIGRFLKPHSKWNLIVKNKVVLKDEKN